MSHHSDQHCMGCACFSPALSEQLFARNTPSSPPKAPSRVVLQRYLNVNNRVPTYIFKMPLSVFIAPSLSRGENEQEPADRVMVGKRGGGGWVEGLVLLPSS